MSLKGQGGSGGSFPPAPSPRSPPAQRRVAIFQSARLVGFAAGAPTPPQRPRADLVFTSRILQPGILRDRAGDMPELELQSRERRARRRKPAHTRRASAASKAPPAILRAILASCAGIFAGWRSSRTAAVPSFARRLPDRPLSQLIFTAKPARFSFHQTGRWAHSFSVAKETGVASGPCPSAPKISPRATARQPRRSRGRRPKATGLESRCALLSRRS